MSEKVKAKLSDGREVVVRPLEYEITKEDWNEYCVNNELRVRVRTIISGVAYAFDENGEQLFNDDGTPVIVIQAANIVNAEPLGGDT